MDKLCADRDEWGASPDGRESFLLWGEVLEFVPDDAERYPQEWRAVTLFFFFQAEDGIRDYKVTGVQTCALPISKNLYEEYLNSESEGYSTDSSGKEKGDTERTLWYENQREIIMKHNQDCEMGRDSETRDISCRKCFLIREEISGNSDFLEFWEWYRKIMNAEMFTEDTVRIFNELKIVMFRDRTDINEENSVEFTLLILSMRYSK